MEQGPRELAARASRRWDEMLDEFRALGGVADNICLKEGRFGRGLFPSDPSKPIKVHVPESLLIDIKHHKLDSGSIRIAPTVEIGPREKTFLENYQRDFSWSVSGRHTEELLQMVHDAPIEVRELLMAPFTAGLWLADPTPKSIAERYLATRVIRYKGGHVVMPIVELANHGHAIRYDSGEGVGLSGQFAGEILVRYGLYDPLELFINWGFASDSEDFALSLFMGLAEVKFSTRREDVKLEEGRKPFFPNVSIENGQIVLSHLLLGHKKFPRLARGIFYRIMRDAGRSDAEETFELIQHINRTQYHKLIAVSEGAAPPLGRLLRDVARFQLEAMSSNIGTREV